jgi:hypothetical protein
MLVLETKHEGISAMQSAATRRHYVCESSISSSVEFMDNIYIYIYISQKKKNHKKEQGTDLFLVIANSCKSNEASCVGNPCVKVRFTSIEDPL